MTARRVFAPHLVAVIVGAALWIATSMLTGRREAWDASAYWTLTYPASILAAALLGYFYPDRSWRWPLLLFASQFVAMCVRNGEAGSLWPLGMAMFAILALPALVAARLASRFSRRPAQG